MPTISVFFGIMIRMYWREHPPAHIHAYYQGHRALIAIETGALIGGRLPAPAEAVVREWVLSHHQALMDNWDRSRQMLPLQQVPGADLE